MSKIITTKTMETPIADGALRRWEEDGTSVILYEQKEQVTIDQKWPMRSENNTDGSVRSMTMGAPLVAVDGLNIPESRTVRINGKWFRLCEDFDAKYQ